MPFACDATTITAGDIVEVEQPAGPSGRPTYPHFFVVMFVPTPVEVGSLIPCLGVTSRTPSEAIDPALHVAMPYMGRRGGHPATGFDRPSVAKVTFQHLLVVRQGRTLPLEVDARCTGRYAPPKQFRALVAASQAFNQRGGIL